MPMAAPLSGMPVSTSLRSRSALLMVLGSKPMLTDAGAVRLPFGLHHGTGAGVTAPNLTAAQPGITSRSSVRGARSCSAIVPTQTWQLHEAARTRSCWRDGISSAMFAGPLHGRAHHGAGSLLKTYTPATARHHTETQSIKHPGTRTMCIRSQTLQRSKAPLSGVTLSGSILYCRHCRL